ncbi:hypothetical protein BH20ACT24_BH20ACT24_04380 [soil metagenome]
MKRSSALQVTLLAGLAFLVSCKDLGDLRQDQAAPVSTPIETPAPATESEDLSCKERMEVTSLPDLGTGGSKSPEDALAAFLAESGGYLSQDQLVPVNSDDHSATFEYTIDGERLAVASVQRHGDSWHIDRFVACSEALDPAE